MELELKEADILRLKPGDILVFRTAGTLSSDAAARMESNLKSMLIRAGHPEVVAAVIDGDARLDVVRVEKKP